MGNAVDVRSQQQEAGPEQSGSTSVLDGVIQLAGNAAEQEGLGPGCGEGAGFGWEDWYQGGGLAAPQSGWTFSLEDENGSMWSDPTARIRLGSTVHLVCPVGTGASPDALQLQANAPGFSVSPVVVVGGLAKVMLFPDEVGRHCVEVAATVGGERIGFASELCVEMDRNTFTAKVQTAHLIAHQQYLQLSQAVTTLGANYAAAYSAYASTLEAAESGPPSRSAFCSRRSSPSRSAPGRARSPPPCPLARSWPTAPRTW